MRSALLAVTVAFTAAIAVLTALDIVRNGLNWLDVPAIGVVVLFAVGIGGALASRPRR